MNFRNFDLNLLRVLDAMLAEPNTTRVGEAIGLSQPAVSSALGRLRDVLGDPLFVREGNSLVPTAFARSLREPVRTALASLATALSGGEGFDPARIDRSFLIGASDFYHEVLMPRLAATVSEAAPNVRLKMLPAATTALPAMFSGGRFDMALSIDVDAPDWIERKLAFRASDVVTARKGHPLLGGLTPGGTLPLDLFCGLAHAIFSMTEEFTHFEDRALAELGLKRHVQTAVSGYYGVARIVAQSDLIGVLPMHFALSVADRLGLDFYRLPFAMPLIGLHLYWPARETADPEHAWLRGLILDLLAPLDEARFPPKTATASRGA